MTVIPREQHAISRKDISENALKVMYRLNKAGYESWLVGGGVRDLLLGKKPKDFDVTTNATPDQVRKLFRNCRLVGRRFRLAHVMFGPEIIEVATFRGHHEGHTTDRVTSQRGQNGMLLRDNIFGSIEEDAQRRDFTINSLYYSVADFTVRDYVGGMKDLQDGVIRLIGNPETRYREDPVRMLRAVRFAAKLNMTISPETAEPLPRLAALLHDSAKEISKDEMRELMRQYPQYAEGGEERPASVWHGICAAILARTRWGVEDEAILSAIACHTAGKAGMSKLDKVVYLADMTSKERDWPGVGKLRKLEMKDLDAAMLAALKQTNEFVLSQGKPLDPQSAAAYEDILAHQKKEC